MNYHRLMMMSTVMVLATGAANAQMREVVSSNVMHLDVGVTRTFEVDKPVRDFQLAVDGIAKVTPLSDHTFAITATAPGEVLATAYGPDGKLVESIMIDVAGTLVKIYGYSDIKDYHGYLCSNRGCGRADTDIAPPSSQTIEVARRLPNGDIVTTSKTYQ